MRRLFFVFIFSFCGLLSAQTEFKLKVSGEVAHPLDLSVSDLSKMPRKDAVMKDKDGSSHIFTGVPIMDVLEKAGVPSGKALHGAENLSKYVLIKCSDGYRVLFSLAELDSSIQDKNVIIADTVDGKPLPKEKGPLRIIAEGEKKPARSSYQVKEIFINSIKN